MSETTNRRPVRRFVVCDKTKENRTYTTLFVEWEGKFPSFAFDRNLTEEQLLNAYREFKNGKLYGNIYANDRDNKGGEDNGENIPF